jgi:hypothetical protein
MNTTANTTANTTTTPFQRKEELKQDLQKQQQEDISPEQELQRKREAEELFSRLQFLLTEGENPSLDILSEVLKKVEEFSLQTARQTHLEPDTRKTLEDISVLLLSSRQMAKNKGIAERLQRIAEESQKALNSGKSGVPSLSKKDVSQEVINFIESWRPVFYLLLSSRDFRVLILDSIKVARRVAYSYTEDISDETEEKFVEGESAEEIAETVKEGVKEKGAPELTDQEWEKIQDDLHRVLALLAKEPSYRDGMQRLFNLLDMFQKTLVEVNPSSVLPKDVHMRRVVGETEELVSTFSGRETLEDFKFHLKNLIKKTSEHEDLHSYLNELKEFILSAKSEDEVQSEEFKERSKQLATRGREIMREFKEDDDLKPFLDSANTMIDNIRNDEFLTILRSQAGIVQSDLSYVDTEGKLQLDTDMLTKLQRVLLPVLVDALKYIPVSKITSSDNYRDIILDKIVICSYDIIPENIRFHLESDSEFSLQDVEVKGTHTQLFIQLNSLRTEIKDVEFYYKKKSFPALEDSGRVTFRIKGEGAKLSLTYKIDQGPKDKVPKVMEGNAHFDITNLEIDFDTSTLRHTVLIPMLTNLFKVQLKKQIEEQVEKNLKNWIDKLGDMMSSTISQANKPFLSGLDMARKTIKSNQLAELYQKRREKLE